MKRREPRASKAAMTHASGWTWAFVAVIAGCAGSPASSRAPEAPVHPLASCPTSFAAAQALEGGSYGAGGGQGQDRPIDSSPLLTCPYPEGECGYAVLTRAGGCSECYSWRTVFRCHSDRVPRADGCPYTAPTAGEPCAGAPALCTYSAWGQYSTVVAECVDGRWVPSETVHEIPP